MYNLYHNFQKNNNEILKSAKDASHDFRQILHLIKSVHYSV